MTLSIKVVPRAARTEIAGTMEDGSLKVRVAAVPEGGKANEELRRFLAGHFGVARDQVEIVAGAAGQRKTVRISG